MQRVLASLSRSLATVTGPELAERERVVLLGCGWGCFSLLRRIYPRCYETHMVSPRNHFVFTPLLTSCTVGSLEFRSITEHVRAQRFRDERHFHLATATHIDLDNKIVRAKSELDGSDLDLPYDKLVVGVGAQTSTFGVPGVRENAYFLKEIVHAQSIRRRIIECFELATQPHFTDEERKELLHFVVVGGGPTGVEFSAELYDFLQQDLYRFFPLESRLFHLTLLEPGDLLTFFSEQLRNFAKARISRRGQMTWLRTSATSVAPDHVQLANGNVLRARTVVWTAGVGPQPLVDSLDWPKSAKGRLLVDEHLRVLDPRARGSVFALGDCAELQHAPLPATAQVAERQGRYLAKYLNALADEPVAKQPAFAFKSSGMLAYVGEYQAVSELPRAKVKGWMSWLLWRSAYLTRLGAWRLRLQVPIDWFKTFVMGRDISRFS